MARPGPDPDKVAEAWEYHAHEGRSVRWIAEKLKISPSTAADWVKQGRAAEQWIDLLDRAEERMRMATRLDFYTGMAMSAFNEGSIDVEKVLPLLLKIEDRRAKLGGLDAPTRVAIESDREKEPDPRTVAAVRAVQLRAADEERQLLEGESA